LFLEKKEPTNRRNDPRRPQDHEQQSQEKMASPPGRPRQQIHPHADIPPSRSRPIGTDRQGPSQGETRSRRLSSMISPGKGLIVTTPSSGFNRSRSREKSTPSPVSTHSLGIHPFRSLKSSRISRRLAVSASP